MSDSELECFKTEIHLAELANSYGYELDRRESSRASFVMCHQDGDKIVVATDTDGHSIFFSVRDDNQHGSVIDFVKWKEGVSLGQARQILRRWRANPTSFFPTAQKGQPLRPEPLTHDGAAIHAQWLRMRPYTRAYSRGYLEKRGLTARTISAFSERIGVDQRGNIVFRHDDLVGVSGWEVKNGGFTGFSAGGRKALFGCKVGFPHKDVSPLLVVTESAIDAMSYYQLNPGPGFYLSFAGSMSPEQHGLLEYALNRYRDARIVAATDGDPQGEKFAEVICTIRPDAMRAIPLIGKDWNDTLRVSGKDSFPQLP
jgi:Toprim-like/Protein of unknown function (DUF3991)